MKPLTLILASLVVSSVLTMTAARGPAVDPPTPGLTPKVQAVLRQTSGRRIRASWQSRRKMAASCACWSRRPHEARARNRRGAAATARSGSAWGYANRRAADTIEYDPARAKEAAANITRAGLSDIVAVIPATPSSRFRRSTAVRLRVPRRLEARLQEVLRHGVPPHAEGAVRGAQRPQQEVRDAATSSTRSNPSRSVLDDRRAVGEGVSVSWKRKGRPRIERRAGPFTSSASLSISAAGVGASIWGRRRSASPDSESG